MTEPVAAVDMRKLAATQLMALVGFTVREARNKWTLLALFSLTTLFLLALATLVSVDVVEGSIASARLFGTVPLEIGNTTIPVADAVKVIQAIIVGALTYFGIVLALFVTGNILPLTLQTGWVDLLASQPLARTILILGRALGAVAVVAVTFAYLFGGSWLVLTWKTGFGNPGFLLAGLVILFTFLCCYSAAVLVGVLTRNSPISIIAGVGAWVLGMILYWPHTYSEWATAFPFGWRRSLATGIAETMYWILPKSQELSAIAFNATRSEPFNWMPFLTSMPFAIGCTALACWWFSRQDY